MARVFTIRFPFKGENHSALVYCQRDSFSADFLVRYMDEDIDDIIPGRQVVLNLPKDVKTNKPVMKLRRDLLHETAQAISGHLQTIIR